MSGTLQQWALISTVAVTNFAGGVLILVFRKRVRLFVKSFIPRMSENAEFWTSRIILVGGLLLMAIPILLIFVGLGTTA